jgi:hypothetical protein
LTLEVRDLEYTGSTLSSRSLKLWRVDLNEIVGVEVVPERLTNTRLDPEDGLVYRCLRRKVSAVR